MLADLDIKLPGPKDKALSTAEQRQLLKSLQGWEIKTEGHSYLYKLFDFDNFQQALNFVNQVGAMAEQVDHHPELTLTWGKVAVSWWTHSLKGLHHNDFILADRVDQACRQTPNPR